MDTTHDAVVVDGLTKRYGDRAAVDHLSFSVPAGAVAGLIGPNGAGKTTIMAMLLGLVQPDERHRPRCSATRSSRPADYLGRVGALIERPGVPPGRVGHRQPARRSPCWPASPPDDIAELIDLVGLTGRGDDRYGAYSLGMKQRLGIAAALLGDPDLVILDEPTNGLDPMGMQDIRDLIGEIAGDGRTVIVSSHLLSELEQVCDWLIVIDRGGLVHLGPPGHARPVTDSLVLRTADAAPRSTTSPRSSGRADLRRDHRRRRPCSSRSTATSTPPGSPPRSTGGPTPPGSCSPNCTTTGPTSRPATSTSSNAVTEWR